MTQRFVIAAAMVAAMGAGGPASAAVRSGIIAQTDALRHGLARPWFTQVQMDRSRARVHAIVLHNGVLFVQTNRAMVHAIDAETGKTLWAKQVGRPDHPSMTPGASQNLLAVVNGSRLYVCNRHNGDLLYEVQVGGAPGAGPAVSEKRAYVPMVTGLVMAYRLQPLRDPLVELLKVKEKPNAEEIAKAEEDRRENLRLRQEFIPPLSCQSFGRALVQPLVIREDESEECVVWPTDRGYLNIGRIDRREEDRFAINFRLETSAGIAARPTYLRPDPNDPGSSGVIFAASRDGFVHAIREKDGQSLWRFSTGEPILEPAVVIKEEVFVATQPGGMYCLDAKTGQETWWARGVYQFIAASNQRVYVADKIGRILVLNIKTGARLDTFDAVSLPIKLINSDTDRLYLATETGLIQCLHELEHSEPIRHGAARQQAAAAKQPAANPQPGGGPLPEDVFNGPKQDPFGNMDDGDPFN